MEIDKLIKYKYKNDLQIIDIIKNNLNRKMII